MLISVIRYRFSYSRLLKKQHNVFPMKGNRSRAKLSIAVNVRVLNVKTPRAYTAQIMLKKVNQPASQSSEEVIRKPYCCKTLCAVDSSCKLGRRKFHYNLCVMHTERRWRGFGWPTRTTCKAERSGWCWCNATQCHFRPISALCGRFTCKHWSLEL